MQNKQENQGAPLDIPEEELAAKKPVRSRPAAAKPATAKPKAGQPVKKPVRKAGKKPVKRAPEPEDDLPVWLARIVDWAMEVPGKLKKLPGLIAKIPGGMKKLWGSWFYRIYFPVVALAVIGIIIGCNWLNGFAADYEASQPVHVADQVAQLFTDGDYERIYALDASAQELSGGDRAFYVQSLSELTAGRTMEYSSAFSSDKNELVYNVTLDGAKFATFTLVPSGQTTSHGNRLWQLGTVTTHVVTQTEAAKQDPNMAPYRIRALPEYVVTVDGRTLGQEDVTGTGIATLSEGFLPQGITAPTLTEYGFFSDNDAPQISVAAADGTPLSPVEESPNIWVCGPREDEAMKAQYSETIVKMAQRIAKYTTQDASRSAALENVVSGSPAEDIIKKFKNDWAPSHKEERFEDMEVSDFWVLSEDCLVCHVKFTYILTSKRQNDYPYPTEYTFCIVRRNGEGRLYNLLFH